MVGVVLETLNIRKLVSFGIGIAVLQIVCFLIGGLIAPAPHSTESILLTKCIDRNPIPDRNQWFFTRPAQNSSCREIIEDLKELQSTPKIGAGQIVFTAQFPLPKDGMDLDMTRWFQQLLGVLSLDIKFDSRFEVDPSAVITLDVRLGYRNKWEAVYEWHELAHSTEERPLVCTVDAAARQKTSIPDSGYYYDCEVLPLFTLGSCHHDFYLVNIRIPVDRERNVNTNIGHLKDVWLVEIHQNGGFTKVWFSLKTTVFPVTLAALVFFWRRVVQLPRSANLLERSIAALGVVITLLNCPVEWLSLKFNLPIWLVLSDIRQGAFYATLVCFWLVFTGEHLMDDRTSSHANDRLTQYWPQLALVGGACAFLGIFEVAERGTQLHNPFYSIWSHPVPAKMGLGVIVLAGVCAVAYFAYLLYLIVRVLRQMLGKRRTLPSLPEARRKFYSGIIYRFTVLIGYTLVCAALSVVFFIFSQVEEDKWTWGERSVEYTSAFITGVYGMWNLYVISVLCLYAPSHKFRSPAGQELLEQLTSTSCTATTACAPSAPLPPSVGMATDQDQEEEVILSVLTGAAELRRSWRRRGGQQRERWGAGEARVRRGRPHCCH